MPLKEIDHCKLEMTVYNEKTVTGVTSLIFKAIQINMYDIKVNLNFQSESLDNFFFSLVYSSIAAIWYDNKLTEELTRAVFEWCLKTIFDNEPDTRFSNRLVVET